MQNRAPAIAKNVRSFALFIRKSRILGVNPNFRRSVDRPVKIQLARRVERAIMNCAGGLLAGKPGMI